MFSLLQSQPDDPSSREQNHPQETSPDATPQEAQQTSPETSQELPPLETQDGLRLEERLRALVPPGARKHGLTAGLAAGLVIALVFGIHERNLAAHLSQQGSGGGQQQNGGQASLAPGRAQAPSSEQAQLAAQIQDTRAQLDALNAKLDSVTNKQQPAPVAKKVTSPARRPAIQSTGGRQKPDPRWKMMQSQIDNQGRQIDAQGKQIDSARQEIAGARTELGDSIARTHEELVVLQKKGERNYYEFDLDKSKNFHGTGPVGISLRKANTKHQYADLELLVDDRQLSKKHLNLYEPVVFYPSDEHRPVELVINSITKNHVRGYISAPRYKTAEMTAGNSVNNGAAAQSGNSAGQQAAPPPRQRLR